MNILKSRTPRLNPWGSLIKYVGLEGEGRDGPAKSVLPGLGGGGVSCERKCTIIFFSQVRYKIEIKKMSYSDSQNYPFPSPPYSKKVHPRSQGSSCCSDSKFSDSFVQ